MNDRGCITKTFVLTVALNWDNEIVREMGSLANDGIG